MITRLRDLSPSQTEHLTQALVSSPSLQLSQLASDLTLHAASSLSNWSNTGAEIISPEATLDHDFAIVQRLDWDTEQLGIPCARLHAFRTSASPRHSDSTHAMLIAGHLREWIGEHKIELVDTKLSTRELYKGRFLEAIGFHLVDVLCTLTLDVSQVATTSDPNVRTATESDRAPLAALSREVYGDLNAIQDRFYLESIIPHERAGRLFGAWFENSFDKQVSGKGIVLVYDEGTGPLGYIALEQIADSIRPHTWYDSLNAVTESARGRGVYKKLVYSALAYLKVVGGQTLITKTQISNQRVINSWAHMGADILESSATYHWTKAL